ncbi:MAG TPA: hypothetical protein VF138_01895 [Caulobacteraceae bacterium]
MRRPIAGRRRLSDNSEIGSGEVPVSLIADVVFVSAAAAFAHFGVTYDVPDRQQPETQRTVARTQVKKQPAAQAAPPSDCPDKAQPLHRV